MKKAKIIGIILLVILIIIFFVFITKKDNGELKRNQIRISAKLSLGMDSSPKEDGAEKNIKTYDVKVGQKIKLGGIQDIEIEISEINKDNIKIKTNKPMKSEDVVKSEFTLQKNKELRIITDGTDAYDCFIFEIGL